MKRKIFSILLALVLVCSFSLVTAVPAAAGAGMTYTREGSSIEVTSLAVPYPDPQTEEAFNAEPEKLVLDTAAFDAQTTPITIEGEVSALTLGAGWLDTAYVLIGLRPDTTMNERNAGVYLIAFNLPDAGGTRIHLQDYTGSGQSGGLIDIPTKNSSFRYKIMLTPSGNIGGTATLEVWVGGLSAGTATLPYGYASTWDEHYVVQPADLNEDFSNAHLFYSIVAECRGSASQTYSATVGDIAITGTDLYSVELDEDWYRTDETVKVTVSNPLANDPFREDVVDVIAVSDTDIWGITVTLGETGKDTGVFTGSFLLVEPPVPPLNPGEVVVNNGDLITVTYLQVTDTATVDDTPPEISKVSPADGTTVTDAKPVISATLADVGSGIDIATGVMAIDDTPDVGATVTASDISYTPGTALAEGEHTVTVDVDDVAGNAATQVSWSFTVDTKRPMVTVALDPGLPPYTYTAEGTITFILTFSEDMDTSVMPDTTFGLPPDLDTHGVTSLGWTAGSLTEWVGIFVIDGTWVIGDDGEQTLWITDATDLAGNMMVEDKSFTFVIDLHAPSAPYDMNLYVDENPPGTVDTVYGEENAVESGSLVEVWDNETARAPENWIGSIDATDWGDFDPIPIGDNDYGEVWVTARDEVGHLSDATRLENDIVDPVITINLVDTPTKVDIQTITGTFTELNLDEITLTVNGSPRTVRVDTPNDWDAIDASLDVGENNIVATIIDHAGNSATAHAYIFLDITPPDIGIDIVPDYINIANVGSVLITVISDEEGSATFTLEDSAGHSETSHFWIPSDTAVGIEDDLSTGWAEGLITASLSVEDEAGNIGSATDTATKDTQAPAEPSALMLTPDPINSIDQLNVTLGGSGEANTTVAYSIIDEFDGEVTGEGLCELGTFTITNINVSDLADGTLIASVTQTDEAGNTSLPATREATKKTSLPTVVIDSEAPDPTNTSPIVLTATFSEPVTGFVAGDITVGNGTLVPRFDESGTVYTFGVIPDADGVVTVSIAADVAEDLAGNPNEAARFSITFDSTPPEVTVISPNGGENWLGGSTHDITWTATDANFINNPITIKYSINGGTNWDTIAANVVNTSPFSWVVPNLESSHCLVRVTAVDRAGNIGHDGSNSDFTMSSDTFAPAVTVNSPNGGESWLGSSTQTITWTATDDKTPSGSLVVDLGYSSNGGESWEPIDFIEANMGAYSWTVPEINSSQCLVGVAVVDTSGNADFDISDNVFTITTPGAPVQPTNIINLKAGWNLVSLMLIPDNEAIETVLEGIDVVSVWAYDASIEDPAERWSSYTPGDVPGDLETMVDGKGYWIEMSASAELTELTIVGQELPAPPVALPAYNVVEGWNLIGFKSTIPRAANSYLLAIDGKYTLVRGYEATYFTVGAGENLNPGYGYWISITEPGTIYP